jgi:hypothetical protein
MHGNGFHCQSAGADTRTENPCVGGSSPPLGTTKLNVNTALEAFLLRGRFTFDPHFDHHQLYRSRFHPMIALVQGLITRFTV